VRNSDKCFRIGGDEFALLLPETATDGADHVVGRISHGVAALKKGIGVTVALADVAEHESSKEAHAAVDEKLVDAKAERKVRR
jgi:GGDEF domain-containing protein